MPATGTIGGSGGALADVIADPDLPAPLFVRLGMACFAAVPQLSDDAPAAMGTGAGVERTAVDGTVNCCIADDSLLPFQRQSSGNLLGRPLVLQELFLDCLEKDWIVKAFARAASLSSLGIHLLRGGREILSSATVPPEFARYGGLVPSQFFRNLSDGISFRRKIE